MKVCIVKMNGDFLRIFSNWYRWAAGLQKQYMPPFFYSLNPE
jgi:hypothetical protein